MRRLRLPQAPLSAYLLLCIVCMALSVVSALGGCSKNQRQDTIRASLVAVNAARDGFVTWDRGQQDAIVAAATTRADGEQKLAAYRAARATVVGDFEVAYHLLAVATTQIDEISLDKAIKEANELVAAINRLVHPPREGTAPATSTKGN